MEGVPELVWDSCRDGRHPDRSSHALSFFINSKQKSLWWCQLLCLYLLLLLSRKLSLEGIVASKCVLLSLLLHSSELDCSVFPDRNVTGILLPQHLTDNACKLRERFIAFPKSCELKVKLVTGDELLSEMR